MDERTEKLITALAEKLGTTSEYLWGILVKQAYITAITNTIIIIGLIIFGIILCKVHIYLSSPVDPKDKYNTDNLYDKNIGAIIIMLVFTTIWFIAAIVQLFCIGDTINGFINPEYCALKEILSICK